MIADAVKKHVEANGERLITYHEDGDPWFAFLVGKGNGLRHFGSGDTEIEAIREILPHTTELMALNLREKGMEAKLRKVRVKKVNMMDDLVEFGITAEMDIGSIKGIPVRIMSDRGGDSLSSLVKDPDQSIARELGSIMAQQQ